MASEINLAARYAVAFDACDGLPDDESRLKLRALRKLCRDVVQLQRGGHGYIIALFHES